MLEFDLVPAEYRTAQRTDRWLRYTGFAILAVVVVTGLARAGLSWANSNLQKNIAAIEQQIQGDVNVRKQISGLQTRLTTLKAENVFRGALAQTPNINNVFETIDKSINDQLWLTKLELIRTRDKAMSPSGAAQGTIIASLAPRKTYWRLGGVVKLIGHSYAHGPLSSFIGHIESSPDVRQVELNKSRLRTDGGRDIIDFEMTIHLTLGGNKP